MKIPVVKCSLCSAVMRRVGEWFFCLLCDCPAGTLAAMNVIKYPPPSEPPIISPPDA